MSIKLSDLQKEEIVKKYNTGSFSQRQLAAEYGVSYATIARCVNPKHAERERVANRERQNQNWMKHKVKRYPGFAFHLEKDADIIEKLDSVENRQGYIKDLIRNDLEKNK